MATGDSSGATPAAAELNVNGEELRQLLHAVRLHGEGAGKVKAIEAAFGCRKGGSASYRRASALFDEAVRR